MHRTSMLTVLLVISLILNVLFAYAIVRSERYGHYIEHVLDRLGVREMKETHQPDYWTLKGWTNSISKQRLHYDVVFFGNSLTYNSDFQQYYPQLKILNLGVSGNTLKDLQRRIPTLVAAHPKKVFIMAGANDLIIEPVDEYLKDYKVLLSIIQESLPDSKIYIQSMLPMNSIAGSKQVSPDIIIEANNKVMSMANTENISYIDIYSSYAVEDTLPSKYTFDGLHLKNDAYSIWQSKIHDYITE